MINTKLKYCLVILSLLMTSACNLTRLVPEGEQLLVKNKIVHKDKTIVDLADENDYLRQKPNRRIFGIFRFHLWAYQSGAKGVSIGQDTGKVRRFLIRIGEPPVLVDTNKLALSAENLSDYYFNKGFLNNEVSFEVQDRWLFKKRAKVIYNVKLNEVWKIAGVEYLATSGEMDKYLMASVSKSKLVPGKRLDFDAIAEERNRLTELMRNNGFYYFNNSFIDFSIDTVKTTGMAYIKVNIRNDRNLNSHTRQRIDKVLVKVGKSGSRADTFFVDSMLILEYNYWLNPDVLARNIHFRPGEYYNYSQVQRTYSDLLGIGLFRFVTIRFSPSEKDSSLFLNAEIVLQTASRHDFIWEPQAITTEQGGGIQAVSERNYGVGNNITLRNRNVFGNGEALNLNMSTSLETQFKGDNANTFNNLRQSLSAEYVIPTMVFFDSVKLARQLTMKSTQYTASYLFEKNVNYTRHVFPFNYSYTFQRERTMFHVTPFRISYNRAIVEPEFLDGLNPESRYYINQLLTNNLITGSVISFFWTSRYSNLRRFWTLRVNPLEMSGNLFSAYYAIFTNKDEINKQILGVKYSQYYRADIDAVYTQIVDENNTFSYRYYFGFGLPYGNTEFLPFERRFFVGGGNSLRAWRPRTIGPGSYTDELNQIAIDKTGELMLQSNVEYRFDIIDKYLYGAMFVDAGNIWNFRANENFPQGEFRFNRFYKEIALNTGIGLRFDFSYLIFRIDWGIALHDPSISPDEGDTWVIRDFPSKGWFRNNSALNFAVGYPF